MTRTDAKSARAIALGAHPVPARAALLFGLILVSVLALLALRSPIL